jgi:hypothetical protein
MVIKSTIFSFISVSCLLHWRELKNSARQEFLRSCKFFRSLLDLGKTSRTHSLHNSGPCALCAQADESIHHLLLGCSFSREVWFRLLRSAGFQYLTPSSDAALDSWRLSSHKRVQKDSRKGFDTLVVLVCWMV